jgi:hypothetical protein
MKSGAKFAGNIVWVLTTSAILIALPLGLALEDEAKLVAQERELVEQQQGQQQVCYSSVFPDRIFSMLFRCWHRHIPLNQKALNHQASSSFDPFPSSLYCIAYIYSHSAQNVVLIALIHWLYLAENMSTYHLVDLVKFVR